MVGYSRVLKEQSTISIIMSFVSKSSNLCETTPLFAWQKICLFGLTWDASMTNVNASTMNWIISCIFNLYYRYL